MPGAVSAALLGVRLLGVGLLGVGLLGVGLGTAPAASGAPDPGVPPPPYVAATEWAARDELSSLRVYPTAAGRAAAGRLRTTAAGRLAWAEVLRAAPEADQPGMRAQFDCHWRFAELAEPGKTSWNLEPWRPVVDDAQMVATGCNPGANSEPF